MTAKHVMDDILIRFGIKSQQNNIQLDICIFQLNVSCFWYVVRSFSWVGTDISILLLQPRNDQEACRSIIKRLPMTVDPPQVGAEIIALGYPTSEINLPRNDSEVTEINLKVKPSISTGRVLDIHRSCRDSCIIRFPSFSVDAKFPEGMSGGAVFNEQKELCGLVCSGGDGKLEGYSTAVSIWPSMIIPLRISDDMNFIGLERNTTYRIHDLARLGYLDFRGHERVEFFKHDNGSDGVRRRHY